MSKIKINFDRDFWDKFVDNLAALNLVLAEKLRSIPPEKVDQILARMMAEQRSLPVRRISQSDR